MHWVRDSRGSAILLLLIFSRLLVALGATFELQLSSALHEADCAFLKLLPFEGCLQEKSLSKLQGSLQ